MHAKDVDDFIPDSFRNYEFIHTFYLTYAQWILICPDNYILCKNWTNAFYDMFKKVFNCVLMFKDHKFFKAKNSRNYFCARAYCKFPKCAKYMFVITHQPLHLKNVSINIYINGNVCHKSNMKYCRPLTLYNRNLAGLQMKNIKPSLYRSALINLVDDDKLISGNLDIVHSLPVLQKCASEHKNKSDFDKDDYIDVLELKKDIEKCISNKLSTYANCGNEEFLQELAIPFFVAMYSSRQINLLYSQSKQREVTLHIDATGSVVRNKCQNNIYYYAGVMSLNDGGSAVPIFEFLSGRHDAAKLSSAMLSFRHFCAKQVRVWPLFKHVEVDFSMALINSCALAWNKMSLEVYLQHCFDIVNNRCLNIQIKNFVSIHICCAHFIKIVVNDVSTLFKQKAFRKFAVKCVALMQNSVTLQQAKIIFEHMVRLFGTEYYTNEVASSIKFFYSHELPDYDINEYVFLNETIDDDLVNCSTTLRESSPFYFYFRNVLTSFDTDTANTSLRRNPYYNIAFLHTCLKKYMPFVPLWCGFFIERIDRFASDCKISISCLKTRNSNAIVENWFGIVKNIVLNESLHEKPGRFIKKVREYINSRLKAAIFVIPSGSYKKQKLHFGLQEEEIWGKKHQKTIYMPKSYFNSANKICNSFPQNDKSDSGVQHINVLENLNYEKSLVPLANKGDWCWFNAAIQAIVNIPLCRQIIISVDESVKNDCFQKFLQLVTKQMDVAFLQSLYNHLISLLKSIIVENVSISLLHVTAYTFSLFFMQNGTINVSQQDSHEFILQLLIPLMEALSNMEFRNVRRQSMRCTKCDFYSEEFHTDSLLIIPVVNKCNNFMNLLEIQLGSTSTMEKNCEQCNTVTETEVMYTTTQLSDILVVVLERTIPSTVAFENNIFIGNEEFASHCAIIYVSLSHHYYTVVNYEHGYHILNDNQVTSVNSSSIQTCLNTSCRVLFLQRKGFSTISIPTPEHFATPLPTIQEKRFPLLNKRRSTWKDLHNLHPRLCEIGQTNIGKNCIGNTVIKKDRLQSIFKKKCTPSKLLNKKKCDLPLKMSRDISCNDDINWILNKYNGIVPTAQKHKMKVANLKVDINVITDSIQQLVQQGKYEEAAALQIQLNKLKNELTQEYTKS